MNIPDGILCSKTHQWIQEEDNFVKIGLTDYIIKQLGDIISIELPEEGSFYQKDEVFATIESIKTSRELYMPVSGEVIEVNEKLINSVELINEEPFCAWLIKIKPENLSDDISNLIDYSDYMEDNE